MMNKRTAITCLASAALLLTLSTSGALANEGEAPSGLATIADTVGSMKELINLNTATSDTLASIPGIGPKIAEAITSYRDAHGAFSQIKDLVNVEGIDMSLVEKIKPFLSL